MEIIANDQGNRITPSYVAFTAEGERLIGDAARNQLTSNPENTVFDAKRVLIGREFKDPAVQSDIKHFPFTVVDHQVETDDLRDRRIGQKVLRARRDLGHGSRQNARTLR